MVDWTPERIRREFDSAPNLTLAELSRITGYSIAELKQILRS